ncbi:MAG: DUF2147 domain-containing protein [Leptospiraceae bacterium]|nr:DUF2147 domain-containing protein [Leptospiraceae bacterium]
MNKTKIILLVTILIFTSSLIADPAPVTGIWRTVNEKGVEESTVEIFEKGGKIFGKINSLKDPNDKNGKPKICTACKGSDKDKPVVGLEIIKGLSADGDKYAGGIIMDPENGNEYKCSIWAEGSKLNVRGKHWTGIFRTQTWLKK